MAAQKRPYFNNHEQPEDDAAEEPEQEHEEEEEEGSDRILSSSTDEKDEYVVINLLEIRKEVQCPICLGIIRKTRTVMECLHRFCRECIDKSMRLGNNECPACRTHCASRRSLRDDPNFDALIAALYPDVDKFEEEEMALHEDEKALNTQIQACIAQILKRQTEALNKKHTANGRRSQGNGQNSHSRGRRSSRNEVELHGFDDNENENGNDWSKDSSSTDERIETRPRRLKKRWRGARPATTSADRGGSENDLDVNRESMGASVVLASSSERLAWGKGGMRSHTRHGSLSGSNGKNARNSRLSKLVDHLQNSKDKDNELGIHLKLVSLDEQRIPSLQRSYFCCESTLSVKQLCQYVALQATLKADEVELYLLNEPNPNYNPLTSGEGPICKDKVQVLGEQETLAELKAHNLTRGYLLLAYKKK